MKCHTKVKRNTHEMNMKKSPKRREMRRAEELKKKVYAEQSEEICETNRFSLLEDWPSWSCIVNYYYYCDYSGVVVAFFGVLFSLSCI